MVGANGVAEKCLVQNAYTDCSSRVLGRNHNWSEYEWRKRNTKNDIIHY